MFRPLRTFSKIPRKAQDIILGFAGKLRHNLFFQVFEWWQRRGIHVLPNNHWTPVPDTRNIDERLWSESDDLLGIDINEGAQLDFLSFCKSYKYEYSAFPLREETAAPGQYYTQNGTFETVDGEVFYCMIQESTPDRIIQFGGGFSTRLLIEALRAGSIDCTVDVFKPYRDRWLEQETPNGINLTGNWNPDTDTEWFDQLDEGDILFIDSSHVVYLGNNLYDLLFNIIPRLSDGVLVHFHDIFLPRQYPKQWVLDRKLFLNEQYFVRAFLLFNNNIKIRWMGGYMHENHPENLTNTFDSYKASRVGKCGDMHVPNSLWLEVCG